jgi:hypothetical protein
MFINTLTNELCAAYAGLNSPSDPSFIYRTYLVNKTTFDYEVMYENINVRNLITIPGTDKLVGNNTGLPFWTLNPSWNTDGSITILSNSAGTDNTGKTITVLLAQVDGNNGNALTGITKPNLIGDPDYVPPYINLTTCPVTVSTICPIDIITTYNVGALYYEASLASSVINNPAVDIIEIQAFNNTTLVAEGPIDTFTAPFASNYFSGDLTGLGGTSYTIQIRYITAPSTVIQTC